MNSTPRFIFLGKPLSVSRSIKHLDHILTSNLSDEEDITAISKDMCRKANHLLHIFSCCDPSVKTHLFSSFCLSLYSAALWRVSCRQLRALEVSFNNVLRKIWSLPRHMSHWHSSISCWTAEHLQHCSISLKKTDCFCKNIKMFSDLRYFFRKCCYCIRPELKTFLSLQS